MKESVVALARELENLSKRINWASWDLLFLQNGTEERTAFRIADRLHKDGISVENIAKYTGLTIMKLRVCLRYGAHSDHHGIRPKFTQAIAAKARERDKFRCRVCGQRPIKGSEKHPVHHLFNPRDQTLDNLLTVCTECHAQLERLKKTEPEEYKAFVMWKVSENA